MDGAPHSRFPSQIVFSVVSGATQEKKKSFWSYQDFAWVWLYRNSQHRNPRFSATSFCYTYTWTNCRSAILSPYPLSPLSKHILVSTSPQREKADRAKMGVAKRTRKFAEVRRIIGQRDARLKKNQEKQELENKKKKESASGEVVREM